MRDNPERGELDPAVDGHRRCKNNPHSVLSCEVWTVHSGLGRDVPVVSFLKSPRGSVANQKIVREISSPGGVAGVF